MRAGACAPAGQGPWPTRGEAENRLAERQGQAHRSEAAGSGLKGSAIGRTSERDHEARRRRTGLRTQRSRLVGSAVFGCLSLALSLCLALSGCCSKPAPPGGPQATGMCFSVGGLAVLVRCRRVGAGPPGHRPPAVAPWGLPLRAPTRHGSPQGLLASRSPRPAGWQHVNFGETFGAEPFAWLL